MRIITKAVLTAATLTLPLLATPTTATAQAPAPAPRTLLVSHATASVQAKPAPSGRARVVSSFVVRNTSLRTAPARTVSLFLVADGRSKSLGSTRTPRIPARSQVRVRTVSVVNARTGPGAYRFRACVDPRPGGSCATSRTASVVVPTTTPSDQGGLVVGGSGSFGEVVYGQKTGPRTITVTNTTDTTIDNLGAGNDGRQGGDFVDWVDTCSGGALAPGASCRLTASFDPTVLGDSYVSTYIAGDNGERTFLAGTVFFGTAVAAPPAVLDTDVTGLEFAERVVDTTSPAQDVTVTNTSSSSTTVHARSRDDDFLVDAATGCAEPLAPGASCVVSVRYRPSREGEVQSSIVLTGDQGEVTEVDLYGGGGTVS